MVCETHLAAAVAGAFGSAARSSEREDAIAIRRDPLPVVPLIRRLLVTLVRMLTQVRCTACTSAPPLARGPARGHTRARASALDTALRLSLGRGPCHSLCELGNHLRRGVNQLLHPRLV